MTATTKKQSDFDTLHSYALGYEDNPLADDIVKDIKLSTGDKNTKINDDRLISLFSDYLDAVEAELDENDERLRQEADVIASLEAKVSRIRKRIEGLDR